MAKGNLNWNGAKCLQWAEDLTEQRMDVMAEVIKREAKKLMKDTKSGVDYHGRATGTFKTKKGIHKTRLMKRRSSAPGEAPAVQSGMLYKSIRWTRLKLGKEKGARRIRATAPHSHLLELGTKSIAPRPSLRPALENSRQFVEAIMERKLVVTNEGGE
jgi:hypothetical protein